MNIVMHIEIEGLPFHNFSLHCITDVVNEWQSTSARWVVKSSPYFRVVGDSIATASFFFFGYFRFDVVLWYALLISIFLASLNTLSLTTELTLPSFSLLCCEQELHLSSSLSTSMLDYSWASLQSLYSSSLGPSRDLAPRVNLATIARARLASLPLLMPSSVL